MRYHKANKDGWLIFEKCASYHQVWRLFSNIRVHEGLTQLFTDIVTLLGVAIPLEQKFGFGTSHL
jgi:membrane associated rhomboid family serine protease